MTRKTNERLKAIVVLFEQEVAEGKLEKGQREAAKLAVKKLRKGLRTKNLKMVQQAIDDLARLLLRLDFRAPPEKP